MKVGVPTEIKPDEYRVALTPAGTRELTDHGHEVLLQKGAGEGSAIPDEEYVEQGARILPTRRGRLGRGGAGAGRQGAAARGVPAGSGPSTRSSPTCTWRRTPT